jgi:hypothetical protein
MSYPTMLRLVKGLARVVYISFVVDATSLVPNLRVKREAGDAESDLAGHGNIGE